MAKQITENQHLILHQQWPNDCCLCKSENMTNKLKQDVRNILRNNMLTVEEAKELLWLLVGEK